MPSYRQKQDIIGRLADESQWTYHFDQALLKNNRGRFIQGNQDGIYCTIISMNHVLLRDGKTDGFLKIKFGEPTCIQDETGKEVFFHSEGRELKDPENSGVVLGHSNPAMYKSTQGRRAVTDFGDMTVVFLEAGAKKIFFHESGRVADFPPTPDSLRQNHTLLKILQKQHAISFPNTQGDMLDINMIKLVIARDFAVEPEIKVTNKLLSCASEDFRFTDKSWTDSAEFTGPDVDVPANYHVESTEDGVNVYIDGERRDWLMANAQLAQQAFNMAALPWLSKKDLRLEDILSGIRNGENVTASNGSPWRVSVYQSEYAPVIAHEARAFLRKYMNMPGRDYLAVNHAEELFILGINEEQLHAASVALQTATKAADKVTVLDILYPRKPGETPSQLSLEI